MNDEAVADHRNKVALPMSSILIPRDPFLTSPDDEPHRLFNREAPESITWTPQWMDLVVMGHVPLPSKKAIPRINRHVTKQSSKKRLNGDKFSNIAGKAWAVETLMVASLFWVDKDHSGSGFRQSSKIRSPLAVASADLTTHPLLGFWFKKSLDQDSVYYMVDVPQES